MSNNHEQLNDAELIKRFNQGEAAVFEVLVNRYLNKAYQIAFGILGGKEDAEEVAQDVFVRIYKALPKFRGDSEFSTWMYRIAVNLAKNKYRWNKSRGAKKNISMNEALGTDENSQSLEDRIADDSPKPDAKADFDEFENNVMAEIQKLPHLYKEALVLRNIEDMSYEDIAKTLNCKLGTIKSRIARAREELRKRLNI